jgi:hypothetical protein
MRDCKAWQVTIEITCGVKEALVGADPITTHDENMAARYAVI